MSTPRPIALFLIQAFVFPLLFCSTLLHGEIQGERIWTNHEGREIKATFVSADAHKKTVTIRTPDFRIFEIGIDTLSEKDQTLVNEWLTDKQPESTAPSTTTASAAPKKIEERLKLKKVPMVVQKESYCVPASAAMIAGYHDLKTDQDEIAKLSSKDSVNSNGTYTRDMILAMQKLGFDCHPLYFNFENEDWQVLEKEVLPFIRRQLTENGPLFVTFKPGVFGEAGHGCVITGYDDRKEELYIHNPWGDKIKKSYRYFATESNGVVGISPPRQVATADAQYTEKIRQAIASAPLTIFEIESLLQESKIPHALKMCSRKDEQEDKRFAKNTARKEGRKILDIALTRNSAVIIPFNESNKTTAFYYVTRPESGGRFIARKITAEGWQEEEELNLGTFLRNWTTRIQEKDMFSSELWDLPMIELPPVE